MIKLFKNTILVVAASISFTANAGIIHYWGEFDLSAQIIDPNTVSVTYTADFTNWSSIADYVYAVDWKTEGLDITDATDIAFSTDALGEWTSGFSNTSANGCGNDNNLTFACAWDDPLDISTAQATSGIVTWDWIVTLASEITVESFIGASAHIGGVFMDCDHKHGTECQAKNLLSEEISVPEPEMITLFGAGLIGLGFARRRRSRK